MAYHHLGCSATPSQWQPLPGLYQQVNAYVENGIRLSNMLSLGVGIEYSLVLVKVTGFSIICCKHLHVR
jgi:hypothetical protein